MGEKLGEAVLELRTDDTQLNAGIAKAKGSAQDLGNTFVASGQRAERSLAGLGTSAAAAGAAASQMAAQAQGSARAAVGLAAGATTATTAVTGLGHGSALATRELLVLMREASRGNFTRMAGSATILSAALASSGQGIQGLVTNLLAMFGLIKITTDAELAMEAASADAAAMAVGQAATIAAAKVTAADVEIALAEAQLRGAATAEAEEAAQARLAAAHDAVAAAAAEATIAEDALSVAEGRAAEAAEASGATTARSVTGLGAALGVAAIAAGLAFAGVESFKQEVSDSGDLDRFAEGLHLTAAQIEEAGGKVEYLGHNVQQITGLTVTWGDVFKGTMDALLDATGTSSSQFKHYWVDALEQTAQVGISAAQVIAAAFAATYSIIKDLRNVGLALVNPSLAGALIQSGAVPSPQKILQDALNAGKGAFGATGKFFHQTVPNDILGEGRKRLQGLSDRNNPPKGRNPPKPKRNAADDELAKLQAQIDAQNTLTQAYLANDAAVIKAEADQKAMVLAVEKHATAAQTAALKDRELTLAIATIASSGAKVISNLNFETDARKKVNDMVAAGLIPASQANDQLQLETKLREPLAALAAEDIRIAATRLALETATGAEKAKLLAQLAQEIAQRSTLLGIISGTTKVQADLNAQLSRESALRDEASNNNQIEQLKLEASLIGASNRERAVALAQLEAEQNLKNMPGLSPAEQQAYIKSFTDKASAGVLTPFQQWAQSIPQDSAAITDALQGIEFKGLDGLADAITGVITGTESLKQAFGDLARSILSQLIEMTIKMLIFKAITAAIGAAGGGSVDVSQGMNFSNSFGAIDNFGGFHAAGGLIPSGKFGIVGEKGPEPVIATPRGAMVLPNSTMRSGRLAENDRTSVSITNINDFRNSDGEAVAGINQRLDQMERDLPARVVSTMQDARQRFVWRGN